MGTGRVIRFDEVKGYGFIAPNDGGEDVFVHANDFTDRDLRVSAGHQVEFQVMEGDRGLKAYDVRIIGDQPARSAASAPPAAPVSGNGRHPVAAQPDAQAAADEELCEIFAEREFVQRITELLLTAAPQLSGATIVELRSHLVQFARKNGWVE